MKFKACYFKKLALFGGSFNPPHLGHLSISNLVLRRLKLNHILWLVVPENPFKKGSDYLSQKTRISLCQKLISHSNAKAIDFESGLKTFETFQTIKKAKRVFPKSKLFWVMGSDSIISFHKWKNSDFIAKNCTLVVVNRKGIHSSVRSKNFIKYNPILLWNKFCNISSTEIREKLGKNWKNAI